MMVIRRLSDYFSLMIKFILESELNAGLSHVEVLVVSQEGLVKLVPSVVNHAQHIAVERVVQT